MRASMSSGACSSTARSVVVTPLTLLKSLSVKIATLMFSGSGVPAPAAGNARVDGLSLRRYDQAPCLGLGRHEHTMLWACHGNAYVGRQTRKFRDADGAACVRPR